MSRFHLAFTLLALPLLFSCAPAYKVRPLAPRLPLPAHHAHAPPHVPSQRLRLQAAAPDIDPGVLALALEAHGCAVAQGETPGQRLAVIDYSLPSSQKRLWLFDLESDRLLHHEHVTHGQGSGDLLPTQFSNTEGSFRTSLGLFRTGETYTGANGYSLRLDGLDAGFNDAARQRAIVIHGAWYAEPALIARQGRLGRSQGCPALRPAIATEIIDLLKHRQWLFAYAEHGPWLHGSRHFGCTSGLDARQILARHRPGGRPSAARAP